MFLAIEWIIDHLSHTYTNSIKVSFPTTGINANALSNIDPIVQRHTIVLERWCRVEEKNGQSPIPSKGMLRLHLYVNDIP